MGKYTKEEAIKIIVSCAESYKTELENKTLLFVCLDKHKRVSCMEFSFDAPNYMHLTGVKVRRPEKRGGGGNPDDLAVSPSDFFGRCIEHKLSPADFEFADDGTTDMKLDVLPFIINKNLSARMIGQYNSTQPRLHTEKLAGGEIASIGFVQDKDDGRYIPNTVLKGDIRDVVSNYVRVVAVYRKCKNETLYKEITYAAKKVEWSKLVLPDRYKYLELPDPTSRFG